MCAPCSEAQAGALLRENPAIRTVWTPESQFRVTQSAYNAAVRHQSVNNLRQARVLAGNHAGGAAQLAELQAQLDAETQVRGLESQGFGEGFIVCQGLGFMLDSGGAS